MLSAIAARKAAAAVSNGAGANSPLPSPYTSTSTSTLSLSKRTASLSSKRKRSEGALQELSVPASTSSAKKKRKKDSSFLAKKRSRPRYFEQQNQNQTEAEDVVVLEDEEDEEEEWNDSDMELEVEDTTKRGYSPSQPIPRDEEAAQTMLSTFIPMSGQNIFYHTADKGAPGTIIELNQSETLTLLGTYRLSVVRGCIQIGGAILEETKRQDVFAPRSSPLPCITAVHDSARLLLQELHTGVEGLGNVCRTFNALFSLHPRDALNRQQDVLRLNGVQLISHQSKYCSPLRFPSSWDHSLEQVSGQLQPDIYLVKGPKRVGKSSFARALVNRLLFSHHQVAYLDLDPGQSEFTPGGLLALSIVSNHLLGPPFTHPTIPVRSHFLGAFSPKSSPALYVEALKDLVQFWARDVGWGTGQQQQQPITTIPLVVNTMGWAKGLGADLTKKVQDVLIDGLAELSSLSDQSKDDISPVVHLYEFDQSQKNPMQTLPVPSDRSSYSFFAHGESPFSTFHSPPQIQTHRMEPAPVDDTSYINSFSAADHRTINIMSYFHAVFPSNPSQPLTSVTATHWDTTLPLLARPPYQVEVGRALDRVFLHGLGEPGDVVQEEIERVLGGAVVALVRCEPGTLDQVTSSQSMTKIPYFPSPSSASCPSPTTSTAIGLALVRSVVPGGSHLHVLTPLPPSTILAGSARVMVKGEMELPIWGMIDYRTLASQKDSCGDNAYDVHRETPFLQWDKAAGLGSEKRRVRRNLMRKGQGL